MRALAIWSSNGYGHEVTPAFAQRMAKDGCPAVVVPL
jgi:hypothetical protein